MDLNLTLGCVLSRGIAHDDLAALPLAGLLHRQRCTQTLLMLPETLAFPEATSA